MKKNLFKISWYHVAIIIFAWIAFALTYCAVQIGQVAMVEAIQRFQYCLIFINFLMLLFSFAKSNVIVQILTTIPFVLHILVSPIGSFSSDTEYIFLLVVNYFSFLIIPLFLIQSICIHSNKTRNTALCTTTAVFYFLLRTQLLMVVMLNTPFAVPTLLGALVGVLLIVLFFFVFTMLTSNTAD